MLLAQARPTMINHHTSYPLSTTGMQNSTYIQILPEFTIGNITKYFITRITSDGKSANDFKNFDNSGFPLFKDGHVQNICAHIS